MQPRTTLIITDLVDFLSKLKDGTISKNTRVKLDLSNKEIQEPTIQILMMSMRSGLFPTLLTIDLSGTKLKRAWINDHIKSYLDTCDAENPATFETLTRRFASISPARVRGDQAARP